MVALITKNGVSKEAEWNGTEPTYEQNKQNVAKSKI